MRKSLFFTVLLILFAAQAEARVYVYEVITETTTFQTASKLEPQNFFTYHGGWAVIRGLKVVKVYNHNDIDLVIEENGLEERNVRYLPHIKPDGTGPEPAKPRPYYWWR